MKQSKRCPKCDSRKIGYLEHQSDEGNRSTPYKRPVGQEEGAGHFFGVERYGYLEAYVCADCGFFESYVKEPAKVPWEKMKGFHWVNVDKEEQGPFR